MKITKANYWPLTAFLLAVLFGGFNAIGVRYTVLELPPFWGAALRFGPAALLMFLMTLYLKLPLPRGKALIGALMYGVFNFGASYAFIYVGLSRVLPGMGQVLLALVPLFTLLFAVLHHQETFRWRSLLGSLLALGGIALVFGEQLRTDVTLIYPFAMTLGAACMAEATVVIKDFPKSHPVTTNAIAMGTGAVILLVMSFLGNEKHVLPTHTTTWIALAFLILIGSCTAFSLSLYVLKHWPASTLSYLFVLLPFVTLTASAWLGQERLSPVLLVGAALVLLGVFFGAIFSSRRTALRKVPVTGLDIDEGAG